MADARASILARIRRELPATPAPGREAAYNTIPRAYEQHRDLPLPDRRALLLHRLADYDAAVVLTTEAALPDAIATLLAEAGERTLLVPPDVPQAWLPNGTAAVRFLRDTADAPLSRAAIAEADAVLTSCAAAIAETGTLLLTHPAAGGRRVLTLLPDHHLCVVRPGEIVATVPEGLRRIADNARAPLTTISGPSATADIEMTRIRGVHGPRRLTVLLLVEEKP